MLNIGPKSIARMFRTRSKDLPSQ